MRSLQKNLIHNGIYLTKIKDSLVWSWNGADGVLPANSNTNP